MNDILKNLEDLEKRLQKRIYRLNPHHEVASIIRETLEFQLEQN